MKAAVLAAESVHVREEVEKIKDRNRVLERSVQVAADAIAAALRGDPTGLGDFPESAASPDVWHDWLIKQGMLALLKEEG